MMKFNDDQNAYIKQVAERMREAGDLKQLQFSAGQVLGGMIANHGVPESEDDRAAMIDMAIRLAIELQKRIDGFRT
jgi:hypothetical protein